MGAMEIVLLIAGAILFIVSFLIPGRGEQASEDTKTVVRDEIRGMIDNEMGKLRSHVDDVVSETIDYAMEKTERSLERLSNEKIMAVNEYSDTVLGEIHKSQEEVMFLYDMLNDKHTNLKNTVLKATETVREAEQAADKVGAVVSTIRQLEEQSPVLEEIPSVPRPQHVPQERLQTAEERPAASTDFSFSVPENGIGDGNRPEPAAAEAGASLEGENFPEAEPKPKTALPAFVRLGMSDSVPVLPVVTQTVAEPAAQMTAPPHAAAPHVVQGAGNMGSKKEQILAMRRQGMEAVAIARELSLGVGEVQLVLGLFESQVK